MTNSALLEQYIKKSGYRKKFIADALSITPYGFALKINNKSEFKASEISILCRLLKITARDKEAIFFAK